MVMSIYVFKFEGIDIILVICLSGKGGTVVGAIAGQVSHLVAVVALVVVLPAALGALA